LLTISTPHSRRSDTARAVGVAIPKKKRLTLVAVTQ
jgi:hypothetical protein